jgi:hypothetical protein
MSVVDFHRWDRNKCSGGTAFDWMNADDERPQFLQVRSMANMIGRGLRKPEVRYYNQNNPRQTIRQRSCLGGQPLTRITNAFGEKARPSDGKNTGKGYVMACFICRQYQKRQTNTNWWCSGCKMPLCNRKRRGITCYQEHIDNYHDSVLGCYTRHNFILPREYRKYSVGNGNDQNNIANQQHNIPPRPILPRFDATLLTGGNDDDSLSDSNGSKNLEEAEQVTEIVPAVVRLNTRQQQQKRVVKYMPPAPTERRETRAQKRKSVTAAVAVSASSSRQRGKRIK